MAPATSSRSPSEALSAYVAPLQQEVSAFADRVVLRRSGHDAAVDADALTHGGAPFRLHDRHGTAQVGLTIRLHYRLVQLSLKPPVWEARTAAYVYEFGNVATPPLELVGYHWHPHIEGIGYPHAHVHTAPTPVDRLHLPTGFSTLRDVLVLAVREFDVSPLRSNWEDALAAADESLRVSLRWAAEWERPTLGG